MAQANQGYMKVRNPEDKTTFDNLMPITIADAVLMDEAGTETVLDRLNTLEQRVPAVETIISQIEAEYETVIQESFTAAREGMDSEINAQYISRRDMVRGLDKEVANLNLYLEASNRISNGNTFATDFGTTVGATMLTSRNNLATASIAGATTVTLITGDFNFEPGTEVTIYDDVNMARRKVKNVTLTEIEFETALTTAFKAGATITKTMGIMDSVSKSMTFEPWTPTTEVKKTGIEYISDIIVSGGGVKGSVTATASGSSKTATLSNGWLVSVYKRTAISITVAISRNNGNNWTKYNDFIVSAQNIRDFSVTSIGNIIHVAHIESDTIVMLTSIDSDIMEVSMAEVTPNAGQYSLITAVDIAANTLGTKLSFAISVIKTSQSANSLITNTSTSVSGIDVVIQANNASTVRDASGFIGLGYIQPNIVFMENGDEVIIAKLERSDTVVRQVVAIQKNAISGTWATMNSSVHSGGTTTDFSEVSAMYTPKALGGGTSSYGRLWSVMRMTTLSDNKPNIMLAYSDDGGYIWSRIYVEAYASACGYPSITYNNDATVTVAYNMKGNASDPYMSIYKKTSNPGFNGSPVFGDAVPIVFGYSGNVGVMQPMLFKTPSYVMKNASMYNPVIFYDAAATKVGKTAYFQVKGTPVELLQNHVRFKLPSLKEIVFWVLRTDTLNVTGEANGVPLTRTTTGNEDQVVGQITSASSTELTVIFVRSSKTSPSKVNKILGGHM